VKEGVLKWSKEMVITGIEIGPVKRAILHLLTVVL
jgi:hypothetical protein